MRELGRAPSRLLATAAAVGTLVLTGLAAPAGAAPDDPDPQGAIPPSATAPAYEAISHRGQRGPRLTENGLRALREAHTRGADRVELDVQPTKDGQLLVMHDRSLNRTTRCVGSVHRRTSAWISRHCRLNNGERVPLLSTYVATARALGQPLMIELKQAPGWRRPVMLRLRAILVEHDYLDEVVVISFSRRLLRTTRVYLPSVRTSWIVRRGAPSPRSVSSVATMASIDARFLTPAVMSRYDAAGVGIYVRVNDSAASWPRFGNLHVRGSVTNHIGALVAWKRGRTVDPDLPAEKPTPADEPATDQPTTDQPATDQPATDEPGDLPNGAGPPETAQPQVAGPA